MQDTYEKLVHEIKEKDVAKFEYKVRRCFSCPLLALFHPAT